MRGSEDAGYFLYLQKDFLSLYLSCVVINSIVTSHVIYQTEMFAYLCNVGNILKASREGHVLLDLAITLELQANINLSY